MLIFSCPGGANCLCLHCWQIRCRRLSLLTTVAINIGFIISPYIVAPAPPADSLNAKRGRCANRRVARFIEYFNPV
jgi:hypothetical protein